MKIHTWIHTKFKPNFDVNFSASSATTFSLSFMSNAPCIDLCGSDEDEETGKQKIMSMARAVNLQTGRGAHPPASLGNGHPKSTRANTAVLTGSKRPRVDSPEASSSSLPRISRGLNDIKKEIEHLEARPKVSLAAKIAALSSAPALHGDRRVPAETTAASRQPITKDVLCIISSDEEDEGGKVVVGREKQRQKKVHANDDQVHRKSSGGLSLINHVLTGGTGPVAAARQPVSSSAAACVDEDKEALFLDSQTSGPMANDSYDLPQPKVDDPGSNNLLAQLAREREERSRHKEQQNTIPEGPLSSSLLKTTTDHKSQSFSRRAHPTASLPTSSRQATILTWNVWFRQDLALEERMILGISAKIVECGFPDFILVQECIPDILEIWVEKASWWDKYECHVQK